MRRTILAALAMLSAFQMHVACAADPTELDEKLRKDAAETPGTGQVFMEVQVNDKGPLHRTCEGFIVKVVSEAGNSKAFMTQHAGTWFGRELESSTYGGAAVLPAGSYTVVYVECIASPVRWNGRFARFNLRAGEVVNLGLLVIDYVKPLLSLTFTSRTSVGDLTPKAVASLKKRAPVAFAKTTRRYMTPNPAMSNPLPPQ